MSKKPNMASALAGIINAKRDDDSAVAETAPPHKPAVAIEEPLPPPAPLATPSPVAVAPLPATGRARTGKCSDKANFSQCSVYLRKDTRKRVGRALEDRETGKDFSELVQELLEQWLASGK